MLKLSALITLLLLSACIPKPQEIKGCGSGQEFSDATLGCISSTGIVDVVSQIADLDVIEDTPRVFALPTKPPSNTEPVYFFITRAPGRGTLSNGCSGQELVPLSSCTYTPAANVVSAVSDLFPVDEFRYRLCNNPAGTSRCGSEQTVQIMISEANEDLPIVTSAANVAVFEGESFFVDIRAARQSLRENDPIYACLLVSGDVAATTAPIQLTQSQAPGASVTTGNCLLIGNEAGNLSVGLASFSATAGIIAGCPNNEASCAQNIVVRVRVCEENVDCLDPLYAGQFQDLVTNVRINPRNFAPAISPATPIAAANIEEEGSAITFHVPNQPTTPGVPTINDRLLLEATDLDGQPLTYEYVPFTHTPTNSGTFVCSAGNALPCTFTPAVDFVGTVSFRYLARDSAAAISNQVTVTWNVTQVNDRPFFQSTGHIFGYQTSPVELQENTTLADRTLRVGEGGGVYENGQVLLLSATTSHPGLLPLSGIVLKRGTTVLGDLSSPRLMDNVANMDADAQNFTLSFTPTANIVSSEVITVTLTVDDQQALNNTNSPVFSFTFNGIRNIDHPLEFTLDPATTVGFQQNGPTRDLVFRATPGLNDWQSASGGSQALTVTVTSSNSAAIDLTNPGTLLQAVGGITVTPGAAAPGTRVWTLTYSGLDEPSDNDLTLRLAPSLRGTSNVAVTISDGGPSTPLTRTITAGVYEHIFNFAGWSKIFAKGASYGQITTALESAELNIAWNEFTVTEGGNSVGNFRVRLYRSTSSDFSTLPSAAILNAGLTPAVREVTLNDTVTLDDLGINGALVPGQRYYFILGIVPDETGEVVLPQPAADRVLEVVMPPDNMVLQHRWMANANFCASAGLTADRENNYRCLNRGLGAVPASGDWFYDQIVHLFVDVHEAGCPYTLAGNGAPVPPGTANDVYYNRDNGQCLYSNGVAWLPYSSAIYGAVPGLVTNKFELPPLAQLSRADALAVCDAEEIQCEEGACPAGVWAGLRRSLPLRREIVESTSWGTTPGWATIENSGDHGLEACNTAGAAGVTFFAGATEEMASFPSSGATVGLTPLLTGSTLTQACKSRYGARDLIGNVGEWLGDTMSCSNIDGVLSECGYVAAAVTPGAGRDDALAANNALNTVYGFDSNPAPVRGRGFSLTQNAVATWVSMLTSGVDRFHLAVGFPFFEDVPAITVPSAPILDASGALPATLAPTALSSDTVTLTWGGTELYALVHGGSWRDGAGGAGRFALELRRRDSPAAHVGHRCVIRMPVAP